MKQWLDGRSRMRRESHVRACESLRVRFLRATRHESKEKYLNIWG